MKTLMIAEKPDQARSFYLPLLERLSGERFERKNNYFESGSFFLSWFFGHLLEQLKPDEYNEKYRKWKMEDLPIIPADMVYKYKSEFHRAQGELLLSLCHASDIIVCGTDPDREGQGIFDTFMQYGKIVMPMKRFWATSLTDRDIAKAWSCMKPLQEYRFLSAARELRADSDWLVGMNASRAYSIIGNGRLPVGRVLTATLALIVKRDWEVENYKESFYYQLKGVWESLEFTYFDETGMKFEDRGVLEALRNNLAGKLFSLCTFKTELKTENPPKPFSLPELQKEANRIYKLSLEKTLAIAQSLYEKKMVTYPRTDSPYLPESDLAEYHVLVRKMARPEEMALLRPANEKPACVKNTESPHTALIVTGEQASLTSDEEKVFELIRQRSVGAFMISRKYRQTEIEIGEETGKRFKTTLRQDIDPGFRKLYRAEEKEEGVHTISQTIDEERLRTTKESINGLKVTEVKKTKPNYFTPATLITAMQTCGRSLENEEARKILAVTKGIGTPATQALYPEQLKKYAYIVEQRGCFCSTPKGRHLIATVSPDLKTPELTAEWELKLRQVEEGKLPVETYRSELHRYVYQIVENARQLRGKMDVRRGEETGFVCPQCGSAMLHKTWGVVCSKKECTFFVRYTIAEKTISGRNIEHLLRKGESDVIKGFKRKDGSGTFDAKLVLVNENGIRSVTFAFADIPCPKCHAGSLRFLSWGAACSDRSGCGFTVSRVVAHKKLTDRQLKRLAASGRTNVIKGFTSREGRSFDARLKFDPMWKVVFDFD